MGKLSFSIPVGVTDRYNFIVNLVKLIQKNNAAWNIPADVVKKLEDAVGEYTDVYSVASNRNTQSPAATAARNQKWEDVSVIVSAVYTNHLLTNDTISLVDREALHIHMSSTGGSSSPAPSTTPIVSLVSEGISTLKVMYSDSTKPGAHSKPENVAFCEIHYVAGSATPPATPAECNESANISRSHALIQFAPEQRGKTVYAYARWVNHNGKTGPWSGIISAIIP
jgi:hypothetical protein